MRNKIAVIVLLLLITTAGVLFGRHLLNQNHDTVTLNVRNVPLAEVAAKIYAQTGMKLSVDPKLEAKITLNVKNAPLPRVLDMLADQSAGRWSRTFAVYDTRDSLGRLEPALRGESSLADAGWTNLAPRFAKIDFPTPDPNDPNGPHIVAAGPDGISVNGQPVSDDKMNKLLKDIATNGRVVINSEVVSSDSPNPPPGGGGFVRGGGAGQPGGPGQRVMKRVVMGPDGTASTTTTSTDANGNVSITKLGPDGTVEQEDQWSRDRLVMNQPLVPQLGDAIPDKATLKTADATAKKVHGHYAIYYSLDKPPAGWTSPDPQSMSITEVGQGKTFSSAPIGDILRNNLGGGIGRLTPEQQVQRARQMRDQPAASTHN